MKFSTLKSMMIMLFVGTVMMIGTNDVKADTMFSSTAVAGFSLSVDDIVTAEEATMIDDIGDEEVSTKNGKEGEIPSIYEDIALAKVKKYLNIRLKPEEDAEIVGKLYKGAAGTVIKTTEDGWTKMESGAVTGWVKSDYIVCGKKAESYANKVCNKKATVKTDTLRVREKPDTDSTIVTLVGNNEEFQVLKQKGDWVAVKIDEDLKGYVAKEYIDIDFDFDSAVSIEEEMLADAAAERAIEEEAQRQREEQAIKERERQEQIRREEQAKAAQSNQTSNSSSSNQTSSTNNVNTTSGSNTQKEQTEQKTEIQSSVASGSRQKIVDYAVQFIGNPYVYGGTSLTNGTDCSGFTQGVYRHFGISISRTSREQATNGTAVSLDNVKPGDLIFYKNGSTIGHVALYIGDGKVVHASSRRTGIKISNMYYRTPCCARSVY